MSQSEISIVYSEQFMDHQTGSHPERPARVDAIAQALKKSSFSSSFHWHEPRKATVDELAYVHTEKLISRIESLANQGGGMADPDTVVCPKSYDVGCLSAGAGFVALDLILQNKSKHCFVVSRPPGHHATPSQSMGFCLFNNIAIAARYAQQHEFKKVLILDWDVHHGNGTQDIFYEDDTVFFISTHQHPHYPGTGFKEDTGKGKGEGFTINIPFPPFTPPQSIVDAVYETIESTVPTFQPDIILISAGFDGHKDDPLGNWLLEEKHYKLMTEHVCNLAEKHCDSRIISFLEGGYNLDSLSASCVVHTESMMGV
jgi:acetoin utilization deacetylase AcuC-like enzyme